MATKKSYKPFIYLFIGIILILSGALGYDYFVLKPAREIASLKNTTTELQQNITELERTIQQNQTITKTIEVTRQSGAAGFYLLTTIILAIILIIVLLNKKRGAVKKRDEIIKYMRKYSYEKDGVKLYQSLKYIEGYYKADHTFPVALVVYSIFPGFHNQERTIYENRGFLVDKQDLDNVIEDFSAISIKDMINAIKETTWGMRGTHYKPYKTKSYEDEALKQFHAKDEAVREAVEFQKAVEERT